VKGNNKEMGKANRARGDLQSRGGGASMRTIRDKDLEGRWKVGGEVVYRLGVGTRRERKGSWEGKTGRSGFLKTRGAGRGCEEGVCPEIRRTKTERRSGLRPQGLEGEKRQITGTMQGGTRRK